MPVLKKGKYIPKPIKFQEFSQTRKLTESQKLSPELFSASNLFDPSRYRVITSGSSDGIAIAAGGTSNSAAGTTPIGNNFIATQFACFVGWKEGTGYGRFYVGIRITRGGTTIWAMFAGVSQTIVNSSNMIALPLNMPIKSDDVVEVFYSGVEFGGLAGITALYNVRLDGILLD